MADGWLHRPAPRPVTPALIREMLLAQAREGGRFGEAARRQLATTTEANRLRRKGWD